MTLAIAELDTPIGALTMALAGSRICALAFTDRWAPRARRLARRVDPATWTAAPRGTPAVHQVRSYFAGDATALDTVDVDLDGTPFQQAVWAAVRRVRAGETASYAAIARAVGAPAAVRAVGAANGANPVCLVVPCHRIIGTDGRLTGYGGGLDRKRWLLAHEATHTHPFSLAPATP